MNYYCVCVCVCVCVAVLNTEVLNSKLRIRWSLSALTDQGIVLPFTGIPFIFLGNRTLSCHHGPDLNKSSKIKQHDCLVAKSVSSFLCCLTILIYYLLSVKLLIM